MYIEMSMSKEAYSFMFRKQFGGVSSFLMVVGSYSLG